MNREAVQVVMASELHQIHRLIVTDDIGQHEFMLEKPQYSVGRDRKADIRLVSQFVSRHHATLTRIADQDDSGYRIEDGTPNKPSANGLLINNRRLRSHQLKHGDEIEFGPGVKAIYHQAALPLDPFDITLISPRHAGQAEAEEPLEPEAEVARPEDNLPEHLQERPLPPSPSSQNDPEDDWEDEVITLPRF